MSEIIDKILYISGKNPYLCYQCGMCSAVCPMASYMSVLPHEVVRLIQLKDPRVVELDTVWTCVSCMACVDRCPRRVDPGILFEAVRQVVLRKGVDKADYRRLVDLGKAPSMAVVALSRKMTG